MIIKETVFILGAGASWHYGYPTGEQLVKDVMKNSTIAAFFIDSIHTENQHFPNYLSPIKPGGQLTYDILRNTWQKASDKCNELNQRLRDVNPLVIDYFLGQNPELSDLGRLMIAWAILEADGEYDRTKRNRNRNKEVVYKDDWYRFILNRLISNCRQSSDLLKNKVTFITFNYDVSLERSLYRALTSISMFKPGDVTSFFSDRILHIYGSIRECPPMFDPLPPNAFTSAAKVIERPSMVKSYLDRIEEASRGIRVIDPHDKSDEPTLKKARAAIANADCVYILGYGFDKNNNERLNLRELLGHPKRKAIQFTNYCDTNRVNKAVSRVLFGDSTQFLSGSASVMGSSKESWYYEKSVRDVYEALEYDLEALEELED
jgi:hypothetical protein